MRKILFTFICLILVSCSKGTYTQEPEMVTVSFEPKYVTSHSMTKGESNPYLDIIESQSPKSLNITIKNLSLDKEYTCVCGENLTIPVGTYQVIYILETEPHYYDGISSHPKFSWGQDIFNVDSETTKVHFYLNYMCCAVFVACDEVSSCSAIIDNNTFELFQMNGYFYGFFDCFEFDIALSPAVGSDFEPTTFNFHYVWPDVEGVDVFFEYGKYYVVHPTSVEKNDCMFGASLPTMVEGEV